MTELVNLLAGALKTPAEVATLILILAQLLNTAILRYLPTKTDGTSAVIAPETVVLVLFGLIWAGYSYLSSSGAGSTVLDWTSVLNLFLKTLVGNAPAAVTSLAVAHGSYKLLKVHKVAGFRPQAVRKTVPPAA
jgi:TRAP-type C4-dicarboxylate transport system permease small subunit